MKKYLLNLILLVNTFTSLSPIKKENAKLVGVGVGAGVGLLASSALYNNMIHDRFGQIIRNEPTGEILLTATVVGAGVGLLAGYLTYSMAKSYTPKSKFKKARRLVEQCYSYAIASREFVNHNEYLSFILGSYGSEWPLLRAIDDLNLIRLNLIEARVFIDAACDQAREYNQDLWILHESSYLYKKIDHLIEYVAARVAVITSWPIYQDQYKRYQENQARVDYLAVESAKIAQRECERNDKLQAQREKQKLAQQAINQAHGNVGVNINL